MESVREQHSLAQHSLVSGSKFDFGDRKSMAQVQTSVHVRERKVSEPFRVFFFYLSRSETCRLFFCRGICLENTLLRPLCLILAFQSNERVTFSCLQPVSIVSNKIRAKGSMTHLSKFYGISWSSHDSRCRSSTDTAYYTSWRESGSDSPQNGGNHLLEDDRWVMLGLGIILC